MDRIPLHRVHFLQSEGTLNVAGVAAPDWATATKLLEVIQAVDPDHNDGRTDVKLALVWADGSQAELTYSVLLHAPIELAKHVRELVRVTGALFDRDVSGMLDMLDYDDPTLPPAPDPADEADGTDDDDEADAPGITTSPVTKPRTRRTAATKAAKAKADTIPGE